MAGAGATHVDNWSRAILGRGQADLSGIGVRLRITPRVQSGTEITLTLELEDAIPLLGDDPEAETLRGITLTNRSVFTELGSPVTLDAREAQRQDLEVLLQSLPD